MCAAYIQPAEMRMIRWMFGVKVTDRFTLIEIEIGTDGIILCEKWID